MPLSARDQAIFEDLARELEPDRGLSRGPDDTRQRVIGPLAMTLAGMAALPAAIASDLRWAGLIGFLVAVAAGTRLLARMPRPDRGWLHARGLLPTVACVDRRSYDGTMVTRRTLILPARLILALIGMILLPLVLATAVGQAETTPPASSMEQPHIPDPPSRHRSAGRPMQLEGTSHEDPVGVRPSGALLAQRLPP